MWKSQHLMCDLQYRALQSSPLPPTPQAPALTSFVKRRISEKRIEDNIATLNQKVDEIAKEMEELHKLIASVSDEVTDLRAVLTDRGTEDATMRTPQVQRGPTGTPRVRRTPRLEIEEGT